jgi:hypothetical protein
MSDVILEETFLNTVLLILIYKLLSLYNNTIVIINNIIIFHVPSYKTYSIFLDFPLSSDGAGKKEPNWVGPLENASLASRNFYTKKKDKLQNFSHIFITWINFVLK